MMRSGKIVQIDSWDWRLGPRIPKTKMAHNFSKQNVISWSCYLSGPFVFFFYWGL